MYNQIRIPNLSEAIRFIGKLYIKSPFDLFFDLFLANGGTFSPGNIVDSIDKHVMNIYSNIDKEEFIMGIYFCLDHGFPEVITRHDKLFIRHHLMKNYIALFNIDFLLSNTEPKHVLGSPHNPKTMEEEIQDILFTRIFEIIKQYEEQGSHDVAKDFLNQYYHWFENIIIPKEHREYYAQIKKQPPQ